MSYPREISLVQIPSLLAGLFCLRSFFWGVLGLGLLPTTAYAQNALNSGDSAWVLIASALVLLMTLPGLRFFMVGWCALSMCYRG